MHRRLDSGFAQGAPRNDVADFVRRQGASIRSRAWGHAQWPFALNATGDSARTLRPVTMLAVAAANFLK
jgi:hypothetical protein